MHSRQSSLLLSCLVVLGGMLAAPAWAADMTPIDVTGFNADIVVEATATPPFAPYAVAFDQPNGYAFYENGLAGSSKGLPAGGAFVSAADGHTQGQFQPYTGANALLMDPTSFGGTLDFAPAAQVPYDRLAIFASSSNGGGVVNLTITFTDSTTSSGLMYYGFDWYGGSYGAVTNTGRVSLFDDAIDDGSSGNPRVYQTTLYLAQGGLNTKAIQSITFERYNGSSSVTAILGISGEVARPPTGMVPISLTGYTRDVIVEATATPPFSGFAQPFDIVNNWAFYEVGLANSTKGLPAGGSFISDIDGSTQVQLAPYAGMNALYLYNLNPTGTLTFGAGEQQPYDTLAVFACSGNAQSSSTGGLTITFTDGSTAGLTYNAFDWFFHLDDNALFNLGRASTTDPGGAIDDGSFGDPRIYQTTFDLAGQGLNQKPIQSLAFSIPINALYTAVFAVSGKAGGAPPVCHGDTNCDGQINFADINPFVLALTNLPAWQAQFPDCPVANVDVNGDGQVNFGDINPFVVLLSGGAHCP